VDRLASGCLGLSDDGVSAANHEFVAFPSRCRAAVTSRWRIAAKRSWYS
jgi:hypothetical protein